MNLTINISLYGILFISFIVATYVQIFTNHYTRLVCVINTLNTKEKLCHHPETSAE
jgi:hypothetical protein